MCIRCSSCVEILVVLFVHWNLKKPKSLKNLFFQKPRFFSSHVKATWESWKQQAVGQTAFDAVSELDRLTDGMPDWWRRFNDHLMTSPETRSDAIAADSVFDPSSVALIMTGLCL